jgi:hypothetical protein
MNTLSPHAFPRTATVVAGRSPVDLAIQVGLNAYALDGLSEVLFRHIRACACYRALGFMQVGRVQFPMAGACHGQQAMSGREGAGAVDV